MHRSCAEGEVWYVVRAMCMAESRSKVASGGGSGSGYV